jgi:drug/metabolite transporter (DMT)-like permease
LIYIVSVLYIFFKAISVHNYLSELLERIDGYTLFFFFAIAASDLTVNLLIFKTFKLEKAGIGASINFLCLIWSLLVDVLLFGQSFSAFEIVGGLIVLATTTSIILFN